MIQITKILLMRKGSLLFFLLFFHFGIISSYAQGCSDAGVCTIGSLSLVQFKLELLPFDDNKLPLLQNEDPGIDTSKTGKIADSTLRTFKYVEPSVVVKDTSKAKKIVEQKYTFQYPRYFFQLSTSIGKGDRGVLISTTQLEANMRLIDKKLFAQVKLPYTYISGNLGNTSGIGDITIGATFIAFAKTKSNLSFSAGVKIPTNGANLAKDTLSLPMVYQTSLGSTDILVGAKYTYKKLDFTVGYQHAFNSNNNGYLHRSTADSNTYNSYFESNKLQRADDAIFRVNRTFIVKKINFNAGLLFIYHLQNDTYVNKLNQRTTIKDSEGLTLNLNFAAVAPLSKKLDFIFIYASPVVVRKVRPDGLTRKFIAQIGIKYNIF